MYERIKNHPTVRKLYAERLAERSVLSAEEAEKLATDAYQEVADAHAELKQSLGSPSTDTGEHELDRTMSREPKTTVPEDLLRSLNEQLVRVPDGFEVHRKLKPMLEKRREAEAIDWAHAESLAYASLLALGVPVRLTGQDTERGTFSQRHLVLHDAKTGERFTPLQSLKSANAPFELHNSPLSEIACLGFEYGYSIQADDALVLWEAQFGDFVNSAQVIVDQFIVSGLAKWGQTSRLTLLLPHGYEGSGPEHSSARRSASSSSRPRATSAWPTAPRRRSTSTCCAARRWSSKPRPLVVMTPKSLLRLPAAISTMDELANGAFERVIDDPELPGDREAVTKLVLCSGKVYYDIASFEERASGGAHRRGPGRAALPVPGERAARADGELPEPRARGLGAGGAAQHGRARVHAPPHGGDPARERVLRLRRPPAARRARRGLHGRAPQGAGAHRARGARPREGRARAGRSAQRPLM